MQGVPGQPLSLTPERAFYPRKEACAILNISKSHLYSLAAKGRIRLTKIGGRTGLSDKELRRIAEEGA